ncbi:acyl-ACP--UDP-N-acetylglucosamine O-acyltransferase [Kiritimatiella glycovorans]|uniref:acyl-ACP--UDP-N-acetylglucosamine O-acyltransferase n=1 Tax=Kiritimatiella glycovorans TaxID=1307763 RepID=UPI00191BE5EB|nr:acyl-ACP--UDP-N-acetylglucosamine O-acyltransferase [Kiritimatiella glycovorans]
MSESRIHRTAVVEDGAELGTSVSVGPFAWIGPGTKIGDHADIGPHAVVHPWTTVGHGTRVHAGAVLGDLPQDLKFEPCVSYVRIGADCVLREGVTVHRGTGEGSVTELGAGCYLMAFSHVGHNSTLGERVIMANGALLGGHVEVGEGSFISGNVSVHQFVRIGRLVMMGGNSGVSRDVPPFCTVSSLRRNRLSGLNTVGLRRAGLEAAARREIKRTYRRLFQSGLPLSRALAELDEEPPASPEAAEMIEFIRASRRGVCGAERGAGESSGREMR